MWVHDIISKSSPAEGAGVGITPGEGVMSTGVPVGVTVMQAPRIRQ